MSDKEKKKTSLPIIYEPADVALANQSTDYKGRVCQDCPFHDRQRIIGTGAAAPVSIMLVSESPSSWSVNNKQVFYGRGGRIIRDTWRALKKLDADSGGTLRMNKMTHYDTYAIQCQVEVSRDQSATIPKLAIDKCSCYLRSAVAETRPKVILAFGATALKALGYKGEKFTDARGRFIEMEIDGHKAIVLPTFSTKHLIAKTGLYNLFYNDFVRAVRLASGVDEDWAQTPIEEITKEYVIPRTVAEVKALCDEMISYIVPGKTKPSQCAIAVDIETNTLNPHREDAKALCISFSWDSGKATAIPLWHKESWWTEAELTEVLEHVQRVLSCVKPKLFHNGKFDWKFLTLRHGLHVSNFYWDTLLGEHLLREDQSGAYSLKILGRSYFPKFANYADKIHELASKLTVEESSVDDMVKTARRGKIKAGSPGFDDGMLVEISRKDLKTYLYGKKKDRKKKTFDSGYERVPIEDLLTYAAIDTDLTRRLFRHQFTRLAEDNFLVARQLMKSHCIPGTFALGKMEYGGIRVDRPYLEFLETELSRVVNEKKFEMDRYWGGHKDAEFNPNSTQHIGHLLYNYGIGPEHALRHGPWQQMNVKSQQWKTDKKTLRAIVERTKCSFTKALLDYRSAYKALSGFVGDIKLLSEYDGFLHTNFHLHGTSTGRLSSSNLNMQNIPKFIAGFNFKKVFIADSEDEVIINLDYKGAEIRVFTAYAHDEKLIQALNDGLDVHSFFAQEIYGTPYEEMMARESIKDTDKERYLFLDQQRTNCKRVVFGILYGAMAKKIAETAGIDEAEAQNVIDKLFLRFPSLKGYMDETVAQIHQVGYVETLFNRRRRFPLQSVNGFFRGQAERRGKNMKIQSTSSDIVLGQLIELDDHIAEVGGRLCITVHDSIVASVKKKYLTQLPDFLEHYCVKRVAEKYKWLPVAFTCDIEAGPSYGETMSLTKYIKQEQAKIVTPDEAMMEEFDAEALSELRDDEEEIREREEVAKVMG